MSHTLSAVCLLASLAMAPVAVGDSPIKDPVDAGRQIYLRRGCTACHSVDGSPGIGSTFKGLFGSQLRMTDGQTLRVDADFIRQSVRDPARHITEGYSNVMPKFAMSDGELDALVAYIRSIGNPQAALPVDVGHSSVVKLIVRDDGAGRDMFVDFDTGRLFTPPEGLDNTDAEAVLRWIEATGVDAMAETAVNVQGLVGFDLIAQPTQNERLTGATHRMFEADQFRLATPGNPVFLSAKGDLPQTWLFQTREGERGVIQIVGLIDEKPRGVRVRYRLIDRAADGAPIDVRRRIERMRQVVLAIVSEAQTRGRWPDALADVRPRLENADGLDGFIYTKPATPPDETEGNVPLLTERMPIAAGWLLVGYADGHLENRRVETSGPPAEPPGTGSAGAKLWLLKQTRPNGADAQVPGWTAIEEVVRGDRPAEYVWQVTSSAPIRMSMGMARWRGERLLAHVGAGTSGQGSAQPHERFVRLAPEDGKLTVVFGRRWVEGTGPNTGEATMTKRLEAPDGASLRIRWLEPGERTLRSDRYLTLWEGQWVREGEVVERVAFLVRLVGLVEKYEGFMGQGDERPIVGIDGAGDAR